MERVSHGRPLPIRAEPPSPTDTAGSQTDPDHGDLSPMNRSTVANRSNLELIEDNYQRWRDDPTSVDETWQFFFQGYDLGRTGEGRARADADPDA
jgi:hypothetical protein